MTVNVSNEQIVIPAGSQAVRQLPGAQVICYQSTGEAFISMDQRGWLPFSRGIELNSPDDPFRELYFKNTTASEITLEVAVVSNPRVFVDRRELAAQVALNGGVQVVNSPLTENGGIVRNVAGSYYNVHHAPLGVHDNVEIVSAAQNVNGLIIQFCRFLVHFHPGNAIYTPDIYLAAFSPTLILSIADKSGLFQHDVPRMLPAGRPLNLVVKDGSIVTAQINYDIL